MAQRNETPVLILSLLITLGLVGGGYWWFVGRWGGSLGSLFNATPGSNAPQPSTTSSSAGAAGAIANFAQVPNVPAGVFRYGGSTSWAPIRLAVDPAIQTARPEFQLRYLDPVGSAPSSTSGIKMVLNGQMAFAHSSRPIEDAEYQQAQQRGFQLKQVPVAIDGLAVAVHPNLAIAGLTLSQLKGIYTGQLRNWSQVGGPNLPIVPISRPPNSGGTVELFINDVLAKAAFAPGVRLVNTTTEALRQVATNPGSIYFASAPEVVPQCTIKPIPIGRSASAFVPPYREPFIPLNKCPSQRNQLNTAAFQAGQYPLTRNLFVVIRQDGSLEEQAGTAYANFLVTQDGQALIEKVGFVRIR